MPTIPCPFRTPVQGRAGTSESGATRGRRTPSVHSHPAARLDARRPLPSCRVALWLPHLLSDADSVLNKTADVHSHCDDASSARSRSVPSRPPLAEEGVRGLGGEVYQRAGEDAERDGGDERQRAIRNSYNPSERLFTESQEAHDGN